MLSIHPSLTNASILLCRWVKAIRLMILPYVDRKWQADWFDWCDIIQNYYEQHGSYASGKSAVDITSSVESKKGKTGFKTKRKITKTNIDKQRYKLPRKMCFVNMTLQPLIPINEPEDSNIITLDQQKVYGTRALPYRYGIDEVLVGSLKDYEELE